jgi:hypothetical protein
MKKKTIILGSLATVFLLTACTAPPEDFDRFNDALNSLDELTEEVAVETREVNGLYSMDIPTILNSTTDLNDEASLQYNNLYNEKYIIVIDEDKQEFVDAFILIDEYDKSISVVDNYANVQLAFMDESVTVSEESSLKSMKINGMDARVKAMDGMILGVHEEVSYWIGYVEGAETMYTIQAMTLKSRKSSFEKEANDMINSLKEL